MTVPVEDSQSQNAAAASEWP